MTYGEAHFMRKENMLLKRGEWVSIALPYHSPRMERSDAEKYYTAKINKAMGWEPKVPELTFEEKAKIALKKVLVERNSIVRREARKIKKELNKLIFNTTLIKD